VILDPNNNPIPVDVVDNEDGTYGVTYNPDFPGPYKVNVTLDGKPIKDVPKIVNVKAGASRKTMIEEFSFIIRSKDKRGQNLKEGGQDIKCSIKDPSDKPLSTVKLTDRKDGSYLVVYSLPTVEGEYTISCTVEDQEIFGSPFIQTVANVYDD